MTGMEDLNSMIETLRQLPQLARVAAPAVAEAMEREAQRTIASGTTAYGVPWKRTQKGNKVPMRDAASALKVAAVGTTIYMRLLGVEARHHRGIARGGVERNVLPINTIPQPMAAAITTALRLTFAKLVTPP